MARLVPLAANVAAFLDMIAHSEGTSTVAGSDDGYNVDVGGKLFDGYADHPRVSVEVKPGLISTAAGRYQLLARYFDTYKRELGLDDFGPEAQDRIALQQIKECHALPLIVAGQFDAAVKACAHIWASLPGAGYGQHENKLAALQQIYVTSGGTITDA